MEPKKKRSGKTLAHRLAAERADTAESPEPTRAEVVRHKLFRPQRDPGRLPTVATAPSKTAEEPASRSSRWGKFRDTLRVALIELAPELPNLLRDWRKRRKAIKAFHLSRKQVAVASAEVDGARAQGEGTTPDAQAKPARALPKLSSRAARRGRIATWRLLRPVLRWQRRTPPSKVLACYFGALGVVSLAAIAVFVWPSPPPPAQRSAPLSAPSGVTMQLGVPARKAVRDPLPDPAAVAQFQDRADAEFHAGNYAAAEKSFRELLPSARFRPLTGFQIFLCLLKQGKSAEASIMANKFPAGPGAKNPSGQYVAAALAITDGRPGDARAAVDAARRQFPTICPLYDRALAAAALAPEIRQNPPQ